MIRGITNFFRSFYDWPQSLYDLGLIRSFSELSDEMKMIIMERIPNVKPDQKINIYEHFHVRGIDLEIEDVQHNEYDVISYLLNNELIPPIRIFDPAYYTNDLEKWYEVNCLDLYKYEWNEFVKRQTKKYGIKFVSDSVKYFNESESFENMATMESV